jgi:hypothetical protein
MNFLCFFPFTKKPDSSKGAEASPSMEEGEACDDCECEIARLPEELLSAAISLTAPRDAFRAAAVSRAFRAAADSDAVWASFLPRDLPDLADGELSPAPPSKKDLFLRLSAGHYHLLPDRLKVIDLISCLICLQNCTALDSPANNYTTSVSVSYHQLLDFF